MNLAPLIDPPLRGIWKAIKSPGHHRFAYDFAASGKDGKLFSVSAVRLLIGKTAVENSYGWSQPVFSPVDGKVVSASDGWPDRLNVNLVWDLITVFAMSVLQAQKVREDLRVFAGNYIIIASEDYYVLLAHLRKDSVLTASDQLVAQGQQLANVGNSGNSAAPHLHLQVNDGPDFLHSEIKEFAFSRYDRWLGNTWETTMKSSPIKGEVMRFHD